jgi:hypothetical protein
MLTTYFDEAGGEDHGFTVVCGWVASIEQWDGFEVDWKLFLAKYDVPYFHMKELIPIPKGHFSKWSGRPDVIARFLRDAGHIVTSRVRQGSCTMYCSPLI